MRYRSDDIPPFRLHKASGRGYVHLDGQRRYLGPYDEPATREAYGRLIAEWEARGRWAGDDSGEPLAVEQVLDAFWTHVQEHYRHPDGTPTSSPSDFKTIIREVRTLYGNTAASAFGPTALRAVRERFLGLRWSRNGINRATGRVRQIFKWAVSQELMPVSVLQSLQTVEPLRRGRCGAPETPAVKPVPQGHIDAVRDHVPRQVWALIQLQLRTAARAGELVGLRAVDLDTSGRIWLYRPAAHKTAWHGLARTIYIGPQAQGIIRPFLAGRSVDAPLFSPAEVVAERREALTAARKTPLSCGNSVGTNRRRRPQRTPRSAYGTDTYGHCIRAACKAAKVPAWSPHRLRHNAATMLEREFGLDVAAIILGHASPKITRLYAERDHAKALEVIAKIG